MDNARAERDLYFKLLFWKLFVSPGEWYRWVIFAGTHYLLDENNRAVAWHRIVDGSLTGRWE